MISTIDQCGLYSQNRETSNNTLSKDGFDTLWDTRDVLLGNRSALNVSDEFEIHGSFFFAEFLVLEGRSSQNGHKDEVQGTLMDQSLQGGTSCSWPSR